MHEWSAVLRRHRTPIALFTGMVLLPSLFLTLVSIRAIRGEDVQQRFHRAQRQREIAILLEADLNDWLFSRRADSAISQALLKFTVGETDVVFPDLKTAIPHQRYKAPEPFSPRLLGRLDSMTDEALRDARWIELYYQRIEAFLQDLRAGRNKGAQFFLGLRALIVMIPGTSSGYVLRAPRIIEHANAKLDELTAAETFRGALRLVGVDIDAGAPAAGEEVPLSGYSFFRVAFSRKTAAEDFLNLRGNLLLYSTGLFLLVTVVAGIFMYRAVSQEIAVSRLKADFVSAVSHEFRTPLSSMLALTERLDSERVIERDALRQYHATLRRDAQRLNILVEKLLDFAQLEEGKKHFSLDRVNLADVAAEAITAFQSSGVPPTVRVIESRDAAHIMGDKTAVVQCLQNLIENAIKYSPPGSPVTVEWGRENGKVYLEVRDQGIGIPPSEHDKIFEKFYRAPNARAWHAQGTGIGLALVHRIVEIHGGSIDVESRPGEGSRFRLVFPQAART